VGQLVLWDIDHTLIDNAGVSKEIYAAAFTALTGRAPSQLAPTEGRTDRLIMREFLRLHDLSEAPWSRMVKVLEAAGAARLAQLRDRGHVLPGVVEGIKALASFSDVHQSVLTGNIRPNARVKLAAFGLDTLLDLDVGAYGSDHEIRAELVSHAQHRAV